MLSQLESGIQGQYQARLKEASKLPPEQQAQARYEAQLQHDREPPPAQYTLYFTRRASCSSALREGWSVFSASCR